MPLTIEVEQEEDGRWLAEVPELPGVLTYGQTRQEAISRAQCSLSEFSRIAWTMESPYPK